MQRRRKQNHGSGTSARLDRIFNGIRRFGRITYIARHRIHWKLDVQME
jgi:hypothetical protein